MNDPVAPAMDLNAEKTAKFRALFLEESAELLRDAERCLQQSAEGADDEATAATLFRAIHSIKSGAAAFGMRRAVDFAHVFESTLEELRRGSFSLDHIRRHMFLRSYDMMETILQAEGMQQALPDGIEADLAKALAGLTGVATSLHVKTGSAIPVTKLPLPQPVKNASIRISLEKIDKLLNLAGELTVLESMLRERVDRLLAMIPKRCSESENLLQGLDQLTLQLRALHEAAMSSRAQPLDHVFQRLPQLVRELAESLGKRATLTVLGGEVEADKTIIDQLMEPLTHILRNAVDHGIETVQQRHDSGKQPVGAIKLEARCIDNRLLITITDDGKGLDLPALQVKANTLGHITNGEQELANLIFQPGLSTAASLSEVSGRGIGLDAVKHSLAMLGGTISVHSTSGQDTCFTLSLPLTLAVMDGMIVSIGDELYVIPLADIQEALSVAPTALIARRGLPPLLRHQERYVPLIDARILLGRPDLDPSVSGLLVVVIGSGIASAGLCIDRIISQQQVVIRPVKINGTGPQLSATILGDGRVALILTTTQVIAALQASRAAA